MLAKLFITTLTAASICSGAPLEPRAGLTAVQLEAALLNTQLAYQTIGDHVVFLGPDEPKGIGQITVQVYQEVVKKEKPLPAKTGTAFPTSIQLELCNAETTATLQLLQAHALLRQYTQYFTAKQKKQMIAAVKKDKAYNEAYTPAFAKYTPLCADSIDHNGQISAETMKDTVLVFEGKTPM